MRTDLWEGTHENVQDSPYFLKCHFLKVVEYFNFSTQCIFKCSKLFVMNLYYFQSQKVFL